MNGYIYGNLPDFPACVGEKIVLYFMSLNLGIHTLHINRKSFLFINQNICCGYSKEPSQGDGSFDHPKQMLSLTDKKIFTILRSFVLS